MTSVETRLRDALHQAGSTPASAADFDALTVRHRRRTRARWAAAGTTTAVIAALAIWAGTGGSTNAGNATLVPAASPSSPTPSPQVVGITTPIVVSGTHIRLDPAGPPPASTASYQRLLAAVASQDPGAPVQVVYGAFTDNDFGYYPSKKLGVGPLVRYFVRRPAVWIIRRQANPPATAYTALDPVTAKRLFFWQIGQSPANSDHGPVAPVEPSTPPLTYPAGISDNGPQISATRWQNVNSWTTKVETTPELSGYPLLTVYAGGATIDHSLRSDAALAAVLVITPTDIYRVDHQQEFIGMEGTIYYPSPHPQGRLKVISASGNLLTLNLVGTSQNYVFNTDTDSFG